MSRGRILILGANGFTGRHACQYFAAAGYEVYASVRHLTKGMKYGTAVVCDLLRKEQVKRIVTEIAPDYVLHVAGHNSVPDSWVNPIAAVETNLLGSLYLLDALRSFPTTRVLIVGSKLKVQFAASQPAHAAHPYGLSKTLQQLAVQSWGQWFQQQIMVAEPSNLIGPGHSTGICALLGRRIAAIECRKSQEPFRFSSLNELRDFVDVRDAVRAYEYILLKGEAGITYPIESGVLRSLGEVLQTFQQETRFKIPIMVSGQTQGGANTSQPVDHSLLRQLGWSPSIPFATSVHEIMMYYREGCHSDDPSN